MSDTSQTRKDIAAAVEQILAHNDMPHLENPLRVELSRYAMERFRILARANNSEQTVEQAEATSAELANLHKAKDTHLQTTFGLRPSQVNQLTSQVAMHRRLSSISLTTEELEADLAKSSKSTLAETNSASGRKWGEFISSFLAGKSKKIRID